MSRPERPINTGAGISEWRNQAQAYMDHLEAENRELRDYQWQHMHQPVVDIDPYEHEELRRDLTEAVGLLQAERDRMKFEANAPGGRVAPIDAFLKRMEDTDGRRD